MGHAYSMYALEGAGKASLLYVVATVLLKRKASILDCSRYAAVLALYRTIKSSNEEEYRRIHNAMNGAMFAILLHCFTDAGSSPFLLSLVTAKCIEGILRHHYDLGLSALILNCLASAQVVTTWFLHPTALHPPYLKFLNRQSELSEPIRTTLSNYRKVPVTDIGKLIMGSSSSLSVPSFIVPYFLHQIPKSFKMYAIVHTLGLAKDLWTWKKSGKDMSIRYASNVIRSTLFLATYCTTGLGILLAANALSKNRLNVGRKQFYLLTWMAGLSSLFEKPHRRMTVASYISIYAIHSLLKGMHSSVAFVCISSLMFYYYDQQPNLISSWALDMYS